LIISASYRTDIPAFYAEWFARRLRAGYCTAVNPYNQRPYRVPMGPGEVDGFVFWTKNLEPFEGQLREVAERGFPFIVQYTINGYPKELERSAVDPSRSVRHMRMLSQEYGSRVAVWRYDTILLTSLTTLDFHRENFESLARALEGATDEVVVSFARIYAKTRRNLERASARLGFNWSDPDDATKRDFLQELAGIAAASGMRLGVCGQRELLAPGLSDASCVDPARLSDVAGRRVSAAARGHRDGCGCHVSRDIGEYETCPHGCVYCYAVRDRRSALARYRAHDPDHESLAPGPL